VTQEAMIVVLQPVNKKKNACFFIAAPVSTDKKQA